MKTYNGNIETIKTNPLVRMRRKAYRPLVLGVHSFLHVRDPAHLCLRKYTPKEENKQHMEYKEVSNQ